MFRMCATTQTCCAGHHFFSQCKGGNATPTIMSSLVQYQAMVDIRATTAAHTDIADVLMSMNGADTVASLPRKESLCLSEIADVIKLMTTTFEIRGLDI